MLTMSREEVIAALGAGAKVERVINGDVCQYRLNEGALEYLAPFGRWTDSSDEPLRNLTVTPAVQRANGKEMIPTPYGKKFDSGKQRMSLVPKGVVNALLRIDRENDGGPEGVATYDVLRDLCDELVDGDYEEALYLCLRILCDGDPVHGPLAGLDAVLEILEFGAKKYDENNWMLLTDPKNRYENAAWRHLLAMVRGEVGDPETGKAHAAHLGCNLVFLTYLKQEGKL